MYGVFEYLIRAFEYGNNATALYHIAVLVDPLSETAQKWSSIIQVCLSLTLYGPLSDSNGQVAFNPPRHLH